MSDNYKNADIRNRQGTLWAIHDWVESTFWNSLSKKLSSFLLLSGFTCLAALALYYFSQKISTTLLSAPEALRLAITDQLTNANWVITSLAIASVCAGIMQVIYLRYLIVRPVRVITQLFEETARGEGDFSRELPFMGRDEFQTLAAAFNAFSEKMRQIIGEVRQTSVHIATSAVQVREKIEETALGARHQSSNAEDVYSASEKAQTSMNDVCRESTEIFHSNTRNLGLAQSSLVELNDICGKIDAVNRTVGGFNETVDALSSRSESIRTIAALIREVADQTNLLALNAAIEAARAALPSSPMKCASSQKRSTKRQPRLPGILTPCFLSSPTPGRKPWSSIATSAQRALPLIRQPGILSTW